LLEGKDVNLRVVEKEDLQLLADWNSTIDVLGEYVCFPQQTRTDLEKRYDNFTSDSRWFLIEKKDGAKVGYIAHFPAAEKLGVEIGYVIVPGERSKGHCTEAVKIMVDYLFLSKDIVRVQAHTDIGNAGSQKVLEKAGFSREGTLRKSSFIRGEWRDNFVYSILREEWKEPKTMTRTSLGFGIKFYPNPNSKF
jgi:ribosomal-protein-alanine N-acetyltransferase